MSNSGRKTNAAQDEPMLKSWVLVLGLALYLLLYGLFVFKIVGDKGQPDWDFGIVEDIPGKSVYSTFPELSGGATEPAPQHVSGKPALAPDIEGGN